MRTLKINKITSIRIHFIGVLLIVALYGLLDPINALLFGGIVNFIVYLTIGYIEAKKDKIIFNPLSFYFLWYSINLGISAIYSAYELSSENSIKFSTALVYSNSVIFGFLIYTIGSFFLHIGLQLNRPHFEKKGIRQHPTIGKPIFIVFTIIALLFQFYTSYFKIFGGIFNFLQFSLIAILSLISFNPNNFLKINFITRRNILFVGSIVVFILNISTTSKAYMMFAFFPLIWFMLYYNVDNFKLIITGSLFILLYFLFVFPLSYDLRASYLNTREVNVTSSVQNVFTGKTGTVDLQVRDRNPVYSYLSRSFDAIAVSYLSTQVDKYGFRYGETMIYLMYSLIPRLFWPEKPNVTQSTWFTYYLGFAPSPEKATTAIGMTATGELYWNFGIAGVILGMFIVGLGFSGLWRLASSNPQYSIISMLLYINIIFGMPNMAEFGSVVTTFVLTYLVFKSAYFIRDKVIYKS
jgi:hypothetical protein